MSELYQGKKYQEKEEKKTNQSLRCAMKTVFYQQRGKVLDKTIKTYDNAPIFPKSLWPSIEMKLKAPTRIS